MLSKWVNSITNKRELSSQISQLRQLRILDSGGMVNTEQLKGYVAQVQQLANELKSVDKEVSEGSWGEKQMEKYSKTKKVYDDKIQLLSNEQHKAMETKKEIIRKTNQTHKLESDVFNGDARDA